MRFGLLNPAILAMTMALQVACDDPTIDIAVAVDSSTSQVTVSLSDDGDFTYATCTDFIKFYKVESDFIRPISSALITYLDSREGYFLDGQFRPPNYPLMCDVVFCESLDGYTGTYILKDFTLVGRRILTEDEKEKYSSSYDLTHDGVVPDSLNEYTSSPIRGEILIEVEYSKTSECATPFGEDGPDIYSDRFTIE